MNNNNIPFGTGSFEITNDPRIEDEVQKLTIADIEKIIGKKVKIIK